MAPGTSFQSHRFHALDAMRGIAAFIVMLFHFYNHFSFPFLKNAFIAVDFFFILSGFVVCHAYGARLGDAGSTQQYLANRLARLFPMLVVGLCLGLVPLVEITREGHANYTNADIALAMALNLLMLPFLNDRFKDVGSHTQVVGQIFPADDPLWSIFAELFASVGFLWLAKASRSAIAVFSALALGVLWLYACLNGHREGGVFFDVDVGWNTQTFIGIFPRVCFGFGCGVWLYRKRTEEPGRVLGLLRRTSNPIAAYSLLLILLLFPIRAGGLYGLIAISILAPMIVALGSLVDLAPGSPLSRISQTLGWLSYPIYCLHRPILGLLTLLDDRTSFSSFIHISIPLAAIVTTLVASTMFGLIFDYFVLQKRLSRLLTRVFATFPQRRSRV